MAVRQLGTDVFRVFGAAGGSSRRSFCAGASSSQGSNRATGSSASEQPKGYAISRGFVKLPTTLLGRFWFSLVSGLVVTFGAFGIGAEIGDAYLDKKYGKFEFERSLAKLTEVEDEDEDED